MEKTSKNTLISTTNPPTITFFNKKYKDSSKFKFNNLKKNVNFYNYEVNPGINSVKQDFDYQDLNQSLNIDTNIKKDLNYDLSTPLPVKTNALGTTLPIEFKDSPVYSLQQEMKNKEFENILKQIKKYKYIFKIIETNQNLYINKKLFTVYNKNENENENKNENENENENELKLQRFNNFNN